MKSQIIKLLALLFLLSVFVNSNAQEVDEDYVFERDLTEKIIQDALFVVLKVEIFYRENGFTSSKIDDDFNIWVDHFPAGFELTQEILDLNLQLKYISINGLTDEQKTLGINGLSFSGVRVYGNKIKLYFSSQNVFLIDEILNIGVDGEGYSFEYEYSCEEQEWILTKMPRQYKFLKK